LLEEIYNIKKEIELIAGKIKERNKLHTDRLEAYEEELAIIREDSYNFEDQANELEAELNEFGSLLKEAFDTAGCPEEGLYVLLGMKSKKYTSNFKMQLFHNEFLSFL